MSENGHHDLEGKDEEKEQLDPDQIYSVNECNGYNDPTVHATGCDGNCGTLEITGIEIELRNEIANWQSVGMSTGGIVIDGFDVASKVNTVIELFIEKGIATREEVDKMFQTHKLHTMRHIREQNEDNVRRARIAAVKSPLFGPNGRPL